MKSIFKLSVLSAGLLIGAAYAGGPEVPMNQTGIYVGIGGGYNSVQVESADQGVEEHNTLSPYVQLGYWGTISDSSWLVGAKTWYKYLDVSTGLGIDNFHDSGYGDSTFDVPHEFSIMATAGYMLSNLLVYLGAGSVLFEGEDATYVTSAVIKNPTPRHGHTYNLGRLSNNRVMWGGAAQVGVDYYIAPTWFLDMAYTYAISGTYGFEISTLPSDKVQVRSQELVGSINKVFAV